MYGALHTMTPPARSQKPEWALAFKRRRETTVGSQEELAARADVSQSLISQIERGVQSPTGVSMDRFGRLLEALGWTPAQFSEATGLEIPFVATPRRGSRSAALSANAQGYHAPPEPLPISPELLEAAEQFGGDPKYAGLREYRWQHWMNTAPHRARPRTALDWLDFYLSVKDRVDPPEPERD